MRCDVTLALIGGATLQISIHAPRMRCDGVECSSWKQARNFNPRTSYEMRLFCTAFQRVPTVISIHAPRMRCDCGVEIKHHLLKISIHAPRMRCDDSIKNVSTTVNISIHAPRMRCDTKKQLNDILF